MEYLNVEIKAKCQYPERIKEYLVKHKAEYKGLDIQTDTYFNVLTGRLKLREGNIENNLIYYERSNQAGPKNSKFQLIKIADAIGLKTVLTKTNGIKVVVKKNREIYYIRNVKFHIDEVPGLGLFVEIEAGNLLENISQEQLKAPDLSGYQFSKLIDLTVNCLYSEKSNFVVLRAKKCLKSEL